jgi:hypothetical protein
LLVENTKTRIPQICAADAIVAIMAIFAKVKILRAMGILNFVGLIALFAVDHPRRKFAFMGSQAIENVLRMEGRVRVGGILVVIARKYQIALFIEGGTIDVLTVDVIGGTRVKPGDLFLKFMELSEERPIEVVRYPIVHRFPLIRPVTRVTIDAVWAFRRIDGDETFSAQNTFLPIERPFVPPTHPPPQSTLTAPRRRRDLNFFVEREIVGFDGERALAVLAHFRFWPHSGILPPSFSKKKNTAPSQGSVFVCTFGSAP